MSDPLISYSYRISMDIRGSLVDVCGSLVDVGGFPVDVDGHSVDVREILHQVFD